MVECDKLGYAHYKLERGHNGTVVTHSPHPSEVSGSNPGSHVGKLVVAY